MRYRKQTQIKAARVLSRVVPVVDGVIDASDLSEEERAQLAGAGWELIIEPSPEPAPEPAPEPVKRRRGRPKKKAD